MTIGQEENPAEIPIVWLERLGSLREAAQIEEFAIGVLEWLAESFPTARACLSLRDPLNPSARLDCSLASNATPRVIAQSEPLFSLSEATSWAARHGLEEKDHWVRALGECPAGPIAMLVASPWPEAGRTPSATLAMTFLENLLTRYWQTVQMADRAGQLEYLLALSREMIGRTPQITAIRRDIVAYRAHPGSCLLTGPPGAGKSHLAQTLARSESLAGRLFLEIPCDRTNAMYFEQALTVDWFGRGPLAERPISIYVHDVAALDESGLDQILQLDPDGGKGQGPILFLGTESANSESVDRLTNWCRGRVFRLPSLAERMDDFPALVDHFCVQASQRFGRAISGPTPEALELLSRQSWPGNIGQLQETMTRAVRLGRGTQIEASDLARLLARDPAAPAGPDVLMQLRSPRAADWLEACRALHKNFDPRARPLLWERWQDGDPILRLEAIRLLIQHALPNEIERVVATLVEEEDRDVLSTALLALSERPEVDWGPLWEQTLPHPDAEVRRASLSGIRGRETAVPPAQFLPLLEDPHPDLRALAHAALYAVGQSEHQRDLLEMLAEPDPLLRIEAVQALGQIPEAFGQLLRVLEQDPDIDVRIQVVESLGQIGDPQAVRPLLRALQDPRLKLAAIESLGQLASNLAVRPLVDLLARESSSLIRRAAIHALATIGDRSAVSDIAQYIEVPTLAGPAIETVCALGGAEAEDSLLAILTAEHPLLRELLEGLVQIGTSRSVEPLIELWGQIPEYLAQIAVEALTQIGRTATPALIAHLPDPDRRPWILQTLARLGDPAAVGSILPYYDESPAVALALERTGPAAIDSLLAALPARATETTDLLIQYGEESIPAAIGLLADPIHYKIGQEVLAAFPDSAIEALLAELENASGSGPMSRVLETVAQIGSRRAIPVLLGVLARDEPRSREAVIVGLSQSANPTFVEGLLELLTTGEEPSQILAIRSLARLGSAAGFDWLAECQAHDSRAVRQAALLASTQYPAPASHKGLQGALSDPDRLIARLGRQFAFGQGLLTRQDLRRAILDPNTDLPWAEILVDLGSPWAIQLLFALLRNPPSPPVARAAREAAADLDSRALPEVIALLEGASADQQTLGQELLDKIRLAPSHLGVILPLLEHPSPTRRAWLVAHLARDRVGATEALQARQSVCETPAEWSLLAQLLASLEEGIPA